MDKIPDWAVDALKALYEEHNRSWKTARPYAKTIYRDMGWKPTTQQVYDILHDILPEDRITACGFEKRFDGFFDGYRFCGRTCECSRRQAVEKSKKTMLERYGAETTLASPELREKFKKTMVERHGVEFSGQSSELLDKTKTTMREKYGVDNYSQTEKAKIEFSLNNPMKKSEIKEKAQKTNLDRFGSVSPLGNEAKRKKGRQTSLEKFGDEAPQRSQSVKDKTRDTLRERYGIDYLQQSEEFRIKSIETMMDRYGVESSLQHEHFRKKREQTCLEKYNEIHPCRHSSVKEKTKETNRKRFGVDNSSQRHYSAETIALLQNKDNLESQLATKSVKRIASDFSVDSTTIYKYCSLYGIDCPQSSFETELSYFISNLVTDTILKNKRVILGGKELDFFIPNLNIGIEFNGLYWHSSIFKDNNYHRAKYELCRSKNIRLIMINEDEWLERSDAVKSHLINILGKSQKGLPARKLELKTVSTTIANDFYAKHHIQGRTGTIQYAIGAYDGVDLVAAMAFNKQRGTGDIELIRYCTSGKSHAGVFSRLFSRAVADNNYDKIISFADLRYSMGDVYHKNGFILVNEISPDYRYVINEKTVHKSSFTKSQIQKKFNIDMSNLTEKQAMEALNIPRIYDCGKLKFVWMKEAK